MSKIAEEFYNHDFDDAKVPLPGTDDEGQEPIGKFRRAKKPETMSLAEYNALPDAEKKRGWREPDPARKPRSRVGRAASEHDEQATFFEILKLNEKAHPELAWVFAIPNGGTLGEKMGDKMNKEGRKTGVWDVFVPVLNYGYGGMFIEFKAGKNDLSDKQVKFGEAMKDKYYRKVAWSWREAVEYLEEYLGYKLKRK